MLAKKDPIKQNWRKLRPIWTQYQNYDLFDKTSRKLGLKRYFNGSILLVRQKHFASYIIYL